MLRRHDDRRRDHRRAENHLGPSLSAFFRDDRESQENEERAGDEEREEAVGARRLSAPERFPERLAGDGREGGRGGIGEAVLPAEEKAFAAAAQELTVGAGAQRRIVIGCDGVAVG